MGAYGDWIRTIATVGTLVTGLVLFAGTMSDRRREYAKKVAIWIVFEDFSWTAEGSFEFTLESDTGLKVSTVTQINTSNLQDPVHVKLKVQNDAEQPIYDRDLAVNLDRTKVTSGVFPVMYDRLNARLGIIAPGAELERSILAGAAPIGVSLRESLAAALTFDFRFTDSAGRTWRRDQTGRLELLHRNKLSTVRVMKRGRQSISSRPNS